MYENHKYAVRFRDTAHYQEFVGVSSPPGLRCSPMERWRSPTWADGTRPATRASPKISLGRRAQLGGCSSLVRPTVVYCCFHFHIHANAASLQLYNDYKGETFKALIFPKPPLQNVFSLPTISSPILGPVSESFCELHINKRTLFLRRASPPPPEEQMAPLKLCLWLTADEMQIGWSYTSLMCKMLFPLISTCVLLLGDLCARWRGRLKFIDDVNLPKMVNNKYRWMLINVRFSSVHSWRSHTVH